MKISSLLVIAIAVLSLSSCQDKRVNALVYSNLRFETPSLIVNLADGADQATVKYLNGHYAPPTKEHWLASSESLVIDTLKSTAIYGQHFTIEGYNSDRKSFDAPYDGSGKGSFVVKFIKENITSQLTIVIRSWADLAKPAEQTQKSRSCPIISVSDAFTAICNLRKKI